jgi:enamine deaminase RidA (YjgF/YER057c/UK114 family)
MKMTPISTPEQKLLSLGLTLPHTPSPGGNYVSSKQLGDVVYLAGAISSGPEGVITGTASAGSSIEEG